MRPAIFAFLGLSGVGKSTMLRQLLNHIDFQHLQASEIIKTAKSQKTRVDTSDQLRFRNIDENQAILINEFWDRVDRQKKFVVLDGHSIIDTPDGIKEIDPRVFEELSLSHVIFLADNPSAIYLRRGNDITRNRPPREERELGYQQNIALISAWKISIHVGVPLSIVDHSQLIYVSRLFSLFAEE